MTSQKSFKARIRARMDKTGESYVTARRQLMEKSDAQARRRTTPRTISPTRTSEQSVRQNTGRTWDDWFAELDAWGATKHTHAEIARWLVEEHGVDGWWAQTVTVAFEQARGRRAPGQRADGTYSVSASKVLNVPVARLFEAFVDEALRASWLGTAAFTVRTSRPGRSLTAAWEDGSTLLRVVFTAKGATKSHVGLAHDKIAAAQVADELKAFWRERLAGLKDLLET